MEKGIVFIVSGPSGTGKTTLCKKLVKRHRNMHFAVSHTTRPPRGEEKEGKAYYFVRNEAFKEIQKGGGFLESAHVHGHYYGTSAAEVYGTINPGRDVVLDIDYQGAFQVRKRLEEAVMVFILPPSMEVLEGRLRKRGQDDEKTIQERLKKAEEEIARAPSYDYCVINDTLESAVDSLSAIVVAERHRADRMTGDFP